MVGHEEGVAEDHEGITVDYTSLDDGTKAVCDFLYHKFDEPSVAPPPEKSDELDSWLSLDQIRRYIPSTANLTTGDIRLALHDLIDYRYVEQKNDKYSCTMEGFRTVRTYKDKQ